MGNAMEGWSELERREERRRLLTAHGLNVPHRTHWERSVLLAAGLPANAEILDVGAADGDGWDETAGRIPEGWRITVTDKQPGMVTAARARLVGRSAFASFEVADVCALPYPDEVFDAVTAFRVLSTLRTRKELEDALQEINRVLRPGGLVCASTVSTDSEPALPHLFDPETGAAWLKGASFSEVERHPYDRNPRRFGALATANFLRTFTPTPPPELSQSEPLPEAVKDFYLQLSYSVFTARKAA